MFRKPPEFQLEIPPKYYIHFCQFNSLPRKWKSAVIYNAVYTCYRSSSGMQQQFKFLQSTLLVNYNLAYVKSRYQKWGFKMQYHVSNVCVLMRKSITTNY